MDWDTDIPLPENKGRGGRAKYPLGMMPVGASFFTAGKTSSDMCSATRVWKLRGLDFSTVTVTENGVNGCRVWRIK